MSHQEHKRDAPKRLKCAVITVSDTRSKESDESGRIIIDALEKEGHEVICYKLVKDDYSILREAILSCAGAHVIITNGGTGIGKRDVSIDAFNSLVHKTLDGFGEIFRVLSYEKIGSAAIMSRASAGVLGNKILLCLPGSPDAVRLALEKLVIPEIGHMVHELSK